MKTFITALMLMGALPAFAQQVQVPSPVPPPLTDQEVAAAKEACHKPDNVVPLGSIMGGKPADALGFKENKEQCKAIDAEHEKRDLTAKAKKEDERKQLESVVRRIKK